LTNRRCGNLLRGFRLLDLLDDLEVLDLGHALTARHAIAEADEYVLQTSRRAWRNGDSGFADQVADDADFLIHRGFARGRELDDHRASSAKTAATAEATAATEPAATAAEIASAPAAAASELTTTFSARSGSFRSRSTPRASVIENARKSDSDDHRTDDNFSHDAEESRSSVQRGSFSCHRRRSCHRPRWRARPGRRPAESS
jgi:hypothetical protein